MRGIGCWAFWACWPGRCCSCLLYTSTVATHCYYCHSPVVLQGKLADDMRPDGVLPFAVDQQKAATSFMDWVRRKRFVPKGFFSEQQVREMTGVYYPHFVTDCEAEGAIDGEGRQVSVAETPKYIITSTRHYHVRREGRFSFRGIMRPALSSANRKLSDGIHPFPLENAKPFAAVSYTHLCRPVSMRSRSYRPVGTPDRRPLRRLSSSI